MDKVRQAGVLEKWVGGVGFRLRRRSTMVMAEAKGLMAVAGQMASGGGGEVSEQKVAALMKSVMQVALLEINDGEVKGEDGGPWAPVWDWFDIEELGPYLDPLFMEFMQSGLSVDPTPPSCAG